MRLSELVSRTEASSPSLRLEFEYESCAKDREILRLSDDSRGIETHSLFVASPQAQPYLAQVLEKSDALILIQKDEIEKNAFFNKKILDKHKSRLILCRNVLQAQGEMAAALQGWPSRHLELVGVTGTNGKTSIVWMLRHIWNESGLAWGMIGTLGAFWKPKAASGIEYLKTGYTTPRAPELQGLLFRMLADGVERVALEVSSEALSLGRLFGCHFRRAVFTNLSQDHLDHHKTMEDYYKAKRLLFEMTLHGGGEAIIYTKDEWGRRLAKECEEMLSLSEQSRDRNRQVIQINESDIKEIPLSAPSRFNAINANLALCASGLSEAKQRQMEKTMPSMPQIPGRFELVFASGVSASRSDWPKLSGLVDYAHTPDALENLLVSARDLPVDTLICVFGCGGDRDAKKRPLMGEIAAHLSDYVFVCDDNPRTEDPASIREQILQGIQSTKAKEANNQRAENKLKKTTKRHAKKIFEIKDRARAIRSAVSLAKRLSEKSLIIVAGKGHEEVQIIGSRRLPFSDRKVLKEALQGVTQERDERQAVPRPDRPASSQAS